MHALMMDFPLTIPAIARRARTLFAHRPVSGRRPDRTITRTSYAVVLDRVRRLGAALTELGVKRGERVATLAWASQEHLEAYLAIPSMGAVLHTLNLRLHPDDLAYIVNDAQDAAIILDESLLPLFEKFRAQTPSIRHVIVIPSGGAGSSSHLPSGVLDYEDVLASASADKDVDVVLDENDAAAMCYTSGTTGRPKGVLYSHRAIVLHSFSQGLVDSLAVGERDVILPIVPMFHVNAWGLPFTGTLFGCGQVFPGPYLDGASVLDLIVRERVSLTAGVPTVWLGMLQELDRNPGTDVSALRTIAIGGSAAPASLIAAYQERHNIRIVHAWGMTELTPLGTVCHLPEGLESAPFKEQIEYRARQGKPLPFVEVRAVANDKEVPWDGQALGELEVRGPWVARQYFNVDGPDSRFSSDGWFRTGDVVTIHPDGCVELMDRAKDLVKSGGEWICSVALENALMSHPAVAEAAVVAVPHPKWDERPLAVVVLRKDSEASAEALRDYLAPMFAKWWLPDAIEFMAEIPRTSVGKFKKSALRDQFKDAYQNS